MKNMFKIIQLINFGFSLALRLSIYLSSVGFIKHLYIADGFSKLLFLSKNLGIHFFFFLYKFTL